MLISDDIQSLMIQSFILLSLMWFCLRLNLIIVYYVPSFEDLLSLFRCSSRLVLLLAVFMLVVAL